MNNLEKKLDELIASMDRGGFGDSEAREHYQRKIDLLKFKIARQDKLKIAIVSALIGSVVGAAVTTLSKVLS